MSKTPNDLRLSKPRVATPFSFASPNDHLDIHKYIMRYLSRTPAILMLSGVSKPWQKFIFDTIIRSEVTRTPSFLNNVSWSHFERDQKVLFYSSLTMAKLYPPIPSTSIQTQADIQSGKPTGNPRLTPDEIIAKCNVLHKTLSQALCDRWHPEAQAFNPIQKLGVQVLGLTIGQLRNATNIKNIHLQAVFFYGIDFNKIALFSPFQVKAVIKGLTPEEVAGLNETQVNGLLCGLNRSQVFNNWFKAPHLAALKAGFEYSEIEELNDYQVEGLRLKLTRQQVLDPKFTPDHVMAIQEGFQYEWIENISTSVKLRKNEVFTREVLNNTSNGDCPRITSGNKLHKPENCDVCHLKINQWQWKEDIIRLGPHSSYFWAKYERSVPTNKEVPHFAMAYELISKVFDDYGRPPNEWQSYQKKTSYTLLQTSDLEKFKEQWKNKIHILKLQRNMMVDSGIPKATLLDIATTGSIPSAAASSSSSSAAASQTTTADSSKDRADVSKSLLTQFDLHREKNSNSKRIKTNDGSTSIPDSAIASIASSNSETHTESASNRLSSNDNSTLASNATANTDETGENPHKRKYNSNFVLWNN